MPKGVLWRHNDIFVSSMGGRTFGGDDALASYDELAERAENAAGFASLLLIPPVDARGGPGGTRQRHPDSWELPSHSIHLASPPGKDAGRRV